MAETPAAGTARLGDNLQRFDPVTGLQTLVDRLDAMPAGELLTRGAVTLGILLLAVAVRLLARRALTRMFARIRQDRGDSETVDHLESVLRKLILIAIGLAAVPLLLETWGIHSVVWLAERTHLLERTTGLAVILALAILGWTGVRLLVEFIFLPRISGAAADLPARARTLMQLCTSAGRFVVVTMALLLALSELGLDIAPLIAGAGILGLAVGFGAQTLVKDILTGLMIIVEDSISVGDYVSAGGHEGVAEKVGVRSLRLRDMDGTLHIVPYSEVTTVKNMTRDFSYAMVEVGVAYHENSAAVAQAIAEAGAALRADPQWSEFLAEDLEYLGVQDLADSAVVHRARIKTRGLHRWAVRRALLGRIKEHFDALGIAIPFPQMTVHLDAGTGDASPAARVGPPRDTMSG